VGVITARVCRTLVLLCPACQHQWKADDQEPPKR